MASKLLSVITHNLLRQMAGARSYERGVEYFEDGMVRGLIAHKAKRNFMKLLDRLD